MVNELHEAMRGGKGKDMLKPILSRLVSYTKTHFDTEERLMRQHGYPEYAAHKIKHDLLTKQAMDLNGKVQQGQSALTLEVMEFLKNWLQNHILQSDKQFAPFLIQKGVK
jgi:hemerythrin